MIFFVSYMLVASLVLINIIIAVLLDEFLTTMAKRYSAVLSPCDLVLCSSCSVRDLKAADSLTWDPVASTLSRRRPWTPPH